MEKVNSAKAELDVANTVLSEKQQQFNQHAIQLNNLKADIARIQAIKTEMDSVKSQLDQCTDPVQKEQLQIRYDELLAQWAAPDGGNQLINGLMVLPMYEAYYNMYLEEFNTAKADYDAKNTSYQTAVSESENAKQLLDSAKERYNTLIKGDEAIKELQEKIEDLSNKIENYKSEINKLEEQISESDEETLEEYKENLEQAKARLEELNALQEELDQVQQGINVTPFETTDEFILGIQNQYGTLLASYDTLTNYKDALADAEKKAKPLKEKMDEAYSKYKDAESNLQLLMDQYNELVNGEVNNSKQEEEKEKVKEENAKGEVATSVAWNTNLLLTASLLSGIGSLAFLKSKKQ